MGYSFDGVNKVITLTSGTVYLDVRDLYSRWKDWILTTGNKFLSAFAVVGGEPVDEANGIYVTSYFFLDNGWKIKPQESNHKLTVGNGILVTVDGSDPFNQTDGSYNVLVQYSQPVKSETVSTGGGGGATPAEVWGYGNRTLTDKDGFAPTSAQITSAILNSVIEGTITLQQALMIMLAGFAGKTTGSGTNQIAFRDLADTVNRLLINLSSGNRSSVEIDV